MVLPKTISKIEIIITILYIRSNVTPIQPKYKSTRKDHNRNIHTRMIKINMINLNSNHKTEHYS